MSEGSWKEAALADFRAWLDDLDEEDGAMVASDEVPALLAGSDLHALYAELAALRQEIRLQSREQGRALRQAEREREGQLAEARRSAVRGCLTPMLEVRDALARGRVAAAAVTAARRWLRPRGVAEVAEGYAMALERFDRILHAAGVRQVITVGETFDARTMVAVQARRDSTAADGTVVEELRPGFVAEDGAVLRAAEVVVRRPRPRQTGTMEAMNND